MKRATPLFVVALVGGGIILGTVVRPVAARLDTTPPQVGWGPATMLLTIAVLIGGLAWNTWQSLHKKHERMTSDHGVKMLALSRSCPTRSTRKSIASCGDHWPMWNLSEKMMRAQRCIRQKSAPTRCSGVLLKPRS